MVKPQVKTPQPAKSATGRNFQTVAELKRWLEGQGLVETSELGALAFLEKVSNSEIDDSAIALAKIAAISSLRILGRVTSGTGPVEEMTGAQVTSFLDLFTSIAKGLAPASGGGTTNFLRADATWAAPPGGGGTPRDPGEGMVLSGNDLDVVANADASMVVNTNDIQVGVLATDAQHGVRGGGTQHAAATDTTRGFVELATQAEVDAGTDTTRSITPATLAGRTGVGSVVVAALSSSHDIASTTGTEVTAFTTTLVAGTYRFEYVLVAQSTNTDTGIAFGVNYTGTTTQFLAMRSYASQGTVVANGKMISQVATATGRMVEHCASRTLSTTSPNLGPNAGVVGANTDCFNKVEGVLEVSDGGDIEFYVASENTNQVSIEAGSCFILTRCA